MLPYQALFVGSLLLLAVDAHASSVTGCRYEAEVKSIADAEGQLTLLLAVISSEGFGHSGAPPMCGEAGTALTFTPDDDAEVTAAAVVAGDKIRITETDVRNGKKHSFGHDFVEKVVAPPPAEPPAAETPAEPAPETAPEAPAPETPMVPPTP